MLLTRLVANHIPALSLAPVLAFSLVFTGVVSAPLAVAQTPAATPHPQRALVNRYCATCHNERLKTAGLLLDKANVESPAADGALWETVVRKLRGNSMPPAGAPRPDAAALKGFSNYLETSLDRAAEAQPNPGRPAVHRLNRAEYANAIRDLLALDPTAIDVAALLPADDAGYGFDNIGDVLTISPLLMEAYLSAARKVSLLALGDATMKPVAHTYDIPKYILQYDRMSEELPFGSRGGVAIAHYFPVSGEYEFRMGLQQNDDYLILGLDVARQMDIRLDGVRMKTLPVGGEEFRNAQMERVKASAGKNQNSRDLDEYYRRTADEVLVVRFPVAAGKHTVGVTFPLVNAEREGVWQPTVTDYAYARDYGHPDAEPAVSSLVVKGPLESIGVGGVGDTASRRRIFICQPTAEAASQLASQAACARQIFTALARRAYRRAVRDADIAPLVDIFEKRRAEGGFEEGVQAGLQRLLVDPEFLFRIPRDPAGAAPGSIHRVGDIEMASRLSFFLWSSIPDDELLDLAAAGKLADARVLDAQVRRMLVDARASALVNNFAGQWLYLRNVKAVWPNPDFFPDFNINLRESFQRETELFFESQLREDRPVTELLSADYTFVNEPLARHYGLNDVYGGHFRRVKVNDGNRRGLLGQASILSVTSFATRTAPTVRGKWLLENLMGTPPPPPPPDVPSLEERKGSDGKLLTMRLQMEAHRANPACASCHRLMDPLGFALENFDATGKWRDKDGNAAIDSTGVLPDGTRFQGPAELRRILLNQPELFIHTVAERMMTYALGRGVEYQDQPAIRKILRDAAPGGTRWSALITGIVKSVPFQMRRVQQP